MPVRLEPYVQLVDVTATAALVAWGGFALEQDGAGWHARPTGETFGVRSAPVGRAAVEVVDGAGQITARETVDDANHAWIEGLEPATTYRYRVLVDGEPWAGAERHDWSPGTLRPAARPLDLRLRTHASAEEPDPVTFPAVGDAGAGLDNGEDGRRQLAVARTMQRLADAFDVRFVVTLGDMIYHGPGGPTDHSGAHDESDDEDADDRGQFKDNVLVRLAEAVRGAKSTEPAPTSWLETVDTVCQIDQDVHLVEAEMLRVLGSQGRTGNGLEGQAPLLDVVVEKSGHSQRWRLITQEHVDSQFVAEPAASVMGTVADLRHRLTGL
jgi:hypothetical protein